MTTAYDGAITHRAGRSVLANVALLDSQVSGVPEPASAACVRLHCLHLWFFTGVVDRRPPLHSSRLRRSGRRVAGVGRVLDRRAAAERGGLIAVPGWGGVAGNSSVKRLPWSGWLSTRIRPPCSWRIFWLTGRPRPVPRPPLRETNTPKIRSRSSVSMPRAGVDHADAGHAFLVVVVRGDLDAARCRARGRRRWRW